MARVRVESISVLLMGRHRKNETPRAQAKSILPDLPPTFTLLHPSHQTSSLPAPSTYIRWSLYKAVRQYFQHHRDCFNSTYFRSKHSLLLHICWSLWDLSDLGTEVPGPMTSIQSPLSTNSTRSVFAHLFTRLTNWTIECIKVLHGPVN